MLKLLSNQTQTVATFGSATNGPAVKANSNGTVAYAVSAAVSVTVNTVASQHYTANDTTMIFTATAHGLVTGEAVTVSNSGGGVPTGLSTSTTYYVIYVDANDFQLATTLANALAGTNLTISSNGTGTQSVIATALASATVQLQKSNDGTNWANDGSSVSITATGVYWIEKTIGTALQYRATYALASGSMTTSENWVVIADMN